MKVEVDNLLYSQIAELLTKARQSIVRNINHTMVYTYFEIGRKIVEKEQKGSQRAEYGKQLLIGLSQSLSQNFGKGFSVSNLEQMRMFYLVYSKSQTLSGIFDKDKESIILPDFKLSWSHYLKLT